jgi:hypothetical protein
MCLILSTSGTKIMIGIWAKRRHSRLTLAIVEFELAWAANVLTSMDYTRERHGEAICRFNSLRPRQQGTACGRATSSAAIAGPSAPGGPSGHGVS